MSNLGTATGRLLRPATDFVLPDEKVLSFVRTWQRTPLGDRKVHRFQVLRGDAVALYIEDVGSWNWERDGEFYMRGFWMYSVAECREIDRQAQESKAPEDERDHHDIVGAWREQLEEKRLRRDHVSTFGAYHRRERH